MAAPKTNNRLSSRDILAKRPKHTITTTSNKLGASFWWWELVDSRNYRDREFTEPLFSKGQTTEAPEAQLDPIYRTFVNPDFEAEDKHWKTEWRAAYYRARFREAAEKVIHCRTSLQGITAKAIRVVRNAAGALRKLVH